MPLQGLFVDLLGTILGWLIVLSPILLYIWLRSRGTLGDAPGRGMR